MSTESKLVSGVLLAARAVLVAWIFMPVASWGAELTLGPFEQGVYDGASPFDEQRCGDPGKDCSDNNQRIRTNDIMQFAWSVVAGGLTDPADTIDSVIFEQTLHPVQGAVLEFPDIPAACLAAPAGNAPDSAISTQAGGSITLSCNLGSLGNGEQKSFSVAVQPSAASPDGAGFTSQQRVYGVDAAGETMATDFFYQDENDYTITAAPAFDLMANRAALGQGEVITHDVGNGLEKGFVYQFTAHIAAATGHGSLGIAPLNETMTFRPVIVALLPDGSTSYDIDYGVIGCEPNRFEWGNAVLGSQVANPGNCTVGGDSDTGFRVSITDTDTVTWHYPAQTIDGSTLEDGPFFVGAYGLEVFIPFSELDRADGIIGNHAGALDIGACLDDFDPSGESGVSNYLDAYEPGYNRAAMPDGAPSNNCTGLSSAELRTDSEFSFRAVAAEDDQGTLTQYAPLISAYHAGDGVAEPGESYATLLFFRNNGSVPLTDFSVCSVFDNSVQVITDRENIGATPGTFAYEGADSPAGFDPGQWRIQYGVAVIQGDDPLSTGSHSNPDFDQATGRFNGRWNRLASLRCDSPGIDWYDDLSGVDRNDVNAVRMQPVDPGTALFAGQEIRLVTPLTLRDSFYGGPRSGQLVPGGTVAAAFGSYRSAERYPGWRANTYRPAPENASTDGDRVTIARAQIDLQLETALPHADAGELAIVLAGNDVIWKISPQAWSGQFSGAIIDNARITLQLSAGSAYNAGCTVAGIGGIAPDSIETDTPSAGETLLGWELGDIVANAEMEPFYVCVNTDAYLPAGSVVSATAFTSADNAVTSAPALQRISLGQAGAILAEVDVVDVLAVPDTDQHYTLRWTNFSSTSSIDAPVIINVLPFNGDGTGHAQRQPASRFPGSISLLGEPRVTFLHGHEPGASEAAIGQLHYSADPPALVDQNPDSNTSNWCSYDSGEFNAIGHTAACPATWADVTAIRFESGFDLDHGGSERQGMEMHYSVATAGNTQGSLYTNVFAVDSTSLPEHQFLVSRAASVRVVSFAIEGRVFSAIDGDLEFDAGSDTLVPDGISVDLVDEATAAIIRNVETAAGKYVFSPLLPGNYVVHLPASEFDETGPLRGWSAAVTGTGAQARSSELLDLGSSQADEQGIRTVTISIKAGSGDATQPVQVVDIALQPNDADGDGIADLDEYGPGNSIANSRDTDGDGIPDYIDTDSDGDGIPDSGEGSVDTDGDGIPDYIDTDSDADGRPDSTEGETDTDGDGIPDYIDSIDNVDTDGDGIPDLVEGTIDTDGDGIPNNIDTDSDSDGIPDAVEKNTDTDHDGSANYIDTDSDADGIDDVIEGTADRNGNGVPDYIDNQSGVDTDGDGIADVLEGEGDTDGDGLENTVDLDADGDGIPDRVETTQDADGDGNANFIDLDSDNDTIPDEYEGARDSDSDSIADFVDLDSDNDSMTDLRERSTSLPEGEVDGRLGNVIDKNKDGIDDSVLAAASPVVDTDFDLVPDYIDLDSDNDGIPDVIEAINAAADENRDGVIDTFTDYNRNGRAEKFERQSLFIIDTDQDGTPDVRDQDSDGDNRSDARESGNPDANGDFIVDPMTDSDRDGVQEPVDADQTRGRDADADGIDDSSDADFSTEPDTDGDGIIDSVDADADGNGYYDHAQRDPAGANPYPDFDSNGTPDFQQTLTGTVTSGVGGEGVGCSITRPAGFDPAMPLLLLGSAYALWCRRRVLLQVHSSPA